MPFKELAGAALFLGSHALHQALMSCANYLQSKLQQQSNLPIADIQALFDVIASIDGLIDNLKNQQPILQSMFDVAKNSSQQLQHAV